MTNGTQGRNLPWNFTPARSWGSMRTTWGGQKFSESVLFSSKGIVSSSFRHCIPVSILSSGMFSIAPSLRLFVQVELRSKGIYTAFSAGWATQSPVANTWIPQDPIKYE